MFIRLIEDSTLSGLESKLNAWLQHNCNNMNSTKIDISINTSTNEFIGSITYTSKAGTVLGEPPTPQGINPYLTA